MSRCTLGLDDALYDDVLAHLSLLQQSGFEDVHPVNLYDCVLAHLSLLPIGDGLSLARRR